MVLQEGSGIYNVSSSLSTILALFSAITCAPFLRSSSPTHFSHRKKREKIIKKQIRKGLRDADSEDPFELFIASTDIRYTYYKESHKILGNTFGMCILQVRYRIV